MAKKVKGVKLAGSKGSCSILGLKTVICVEWTGEVRNLKKAQLLENFE